MAKYEKIVHGNFEKIVAQLNDDILDSGASMNLVDKSDYNNANIKIAVRVYDKYFMRNSSRASLSVTVVENGEEIFVTAIGAGGGNGAFFNFSWGTEGEIIEAVENSINKMKL